jgi:hypothetical protein
VNDWQPIETAPRDKQYHVVAKIENGKMAWWHRAKFVGGAGWKYRTGWCVPTHWLPLPGPPAREPQEQMR